MNAMGKAAIVIATNGYERLDLTQTEVSAQA